MGADFVFLHGGGQGSWVWHETIAALRLQAGDRCGQVLALDVPGCGLKRGEQTAGLGVADVVASLVTDLDTGALDRPILVGHSQAGTMLPLLLAARPGLFRHAVYVSCLAPVGPQTALSWRGEMPEDGSALPHDMAVGSRDFFRALFCNDMPPAVADAFLDRLGHDQWPSATYAMTGWDYDHLRGGAATYVQCLRDAALVPSWQALFAERLHVERTVRIDAGHQVMNTRPHALAEILLDTARRAVGNPAT